MYCFARSALIQFDDEDQENGIAVLNVVPAAAAAADQVKAPVDGELRRGRRAQPLDGAADFPIDAVEGVGVDPTTGCQVRARS